MRGRQESYIARSQLVTAEMVAIWPVHRRLFNNTVAILGPLL